MLRLLALFAWCWSGSSFAADEVAQDGEARVVDLIDDTEHMNSSERIAYLQALLKAGRESDGVSEALAQALELTKAGSTYDEALAAARALFGQAEAPVTRPLAMPVTDDDLTAEELAAVRAYRARHYAIRTETHTSGGGTRVWSSPYAWGGTMVTREPIVTTRTWAVYEGPVRLDVPQYYALAGETERHDFLAQRIAMKQWLGRTYYAGAAGGIAAVIVGAIGVSATDNTEKKDKWAQVGVTGLGVAVIGLIGGSLPIANAQRLKTEYALSDIDIASAQAVIDARNEAIRVELGVAPEEALSIEESTGHGAIR